MLRRNIEIATDLYGFHHPEIEICLVACPAFYNFVQAWHRLKRAIERIEDFRSEMSVYPLYKMIGNYYFCISTSFLNFDDSYIWDKEEYQKQYANILNSNFSSLFEPAKFLNEKLDIIMREMTSIPNPICHNALQIISMETNNVAILHPYLNIKKVNESFMKNYSSSSKMKFVSPLDLRAETLFKRILLLGAPAWYAHSLEHIFQASRSSKITILCWDFFWGEYNPYENHFFSFATQDDQEKMGKVCGRKFSLKSQKMPEDIEIKPKLSSAVNLTQNISHQIEEKLKKEWQYQENENHKNSMRLYLLEDSYYTFLSNNEESRVDIIDIDTLHRKSWKVSDLEEEMYLLLRTEGTGDYVSIMADKIVGDEEKQKYDEISDTWKSLLESYLQRFGYEKTIKDLKSEGCSDVANADNLRNWISPRNIGLGKQEDFKALLTLIGHGEKHSIYWEVIRRRRAAHIKAGHALMKMLQAEIDGANMNNLRLTGIQDFELKGEWSAGSLTAIRIRRKTEIVKEMPASWDGRLEYLPRNLTEELWQET